MAAIIKQPAWRRSYLSPVETGSTAPELLDKYLGLQAMLDHSVDRAMRREVSWTEESSPRTELRVRMAEIADEWRVFRDADEIQFYQALKARERQRQKAEELRQYFTEQIKIEGDGCCWKVFGVCLGSALLLGFIAQFRLSRYEQSGVPLTSLPSSAPTPPSGWAAQPLCWGLPCSLCTAN